MSRIAHIVIAALVALSTLLIGGVSPATAADGYGASYATRLSIDIKTDCCFGLPAAVGINVSSDVNARSGAARGASRRAVGDYTGTARVLLDGKLLQTVPVGADGKAAMEIPFHVLTVGKHVIAANYEPAAGSVYQGASASRPFNVIHCHAGKDEKLPNTGGILPTTGGPWLGILILALLLLALGYWLMRRKQDETD